jgi:hypothetical protein
MVVDGWFYRDATRFSINSMLQQGRAYHQADSSWLGPTNQLQWYSAYNISYTAVLTWARINALVPSNTSTLVSKGNQLTLLEGNKDL